MLAVPQKQQLIKNGAIAQFSKYARYGRLAGSKEPSARPDARCPWMDD
jgi:hypothetical protein